MKKGDVVRIEYVGRLESGEIFDLTSEELAKKEKIFNHRTKYGSVPVVIGANFILPGLDKELEKMTVGEETEATIEPQDAFGKRRADMVKTIPLRSFREEPSPGTMVNVGDKVGRVQTVSSGRALVDFNHPLAGKKLKYRVKITERIEAEKDKIEAVLEFFRATADRIEIKEDTVRIFSSAPKPARDMAAEVIMKFLPINTVEFMERYEKKNEQTEKNAISAKSKQT